MKGAVQKMFSIIIIITLSVTDILWHCIYMEHIIFHYLQLYHTSVPKLISFFTQSGVSRQKIPGVKICHRI